MSRAHMFPRRGLTLDVGGTARNPASRTRSPVSAPSDACSRAQVADVYGENLKKQIYFLELEVKYLKEKMAQSAAGQQRTSRSFASGLPSYSAIPAPPQANVAPGSVGLLRSSLSETPSRPGQLAPVVHPTHAPLPNSASSTPRPQGPGSVISVSSMTGRAGAESSTHGLVAYEAQLPASSGASAPNVTPPAESTQVPEIPACAKGSTSSSSCASLSGVAQPSEQATSSSHERAPNIGLPSRMTVELQSKETQTAPCPAVSASTSMDFVPVPAGAASSVSASTSMDFVARRASAVSASTSMEFVAAVSASSVSTSTSMDFVPPVSAPAAPLSASTAVSASTSMDFAPAVSAGVQVTSPRSHATSQTPPATPPRHATQVSQMHSGIQTKISQVGVAVQAQSPHQSATTQTGVTQIQVNGTQTTPRNTPRTTPRRSVSEAPPPPMSLESGTVPSPQTAPESLDDLAREAQGLVMLSENIRTLKEQYVKRETDHRQELHDQVERFAAEKEVWFPCCLSRVCGWRSTDGRR